MARYTYKSNANDGVVFSYDPSYTNARAGTGTKVTNDLGPNLIGAGQWVNAGNYWLRQAFLQFTHAPVPSTELCTSAAFVLEGLEHIPTGDPWSLVVREYDYDTTVTEADWVPGSDITSVAPNRLCEWYNIRTLRPMPQQFRTGGRELIETLATAAAPLSTMWHSNKLILGYLPGGNGDEYVHFGTNEAGPNYYRPRLDYQTTTLSSLTRTEGAAAQLSDGTHVYLDLAAGVLTLKHHDGTSASTVATLQTSDTVAGAFQLADGAQSLAVVVDGSDNVYVLGRDGAGYNQLTGKAFVKGAGYTWTAKAALTDDLIYHDAEVNQVTATWHNTGGGFLAVAVSHRQGHEVRGEAQLVVASCAALRAGAGKLFTDGAYVDPQLYGAPVAPYGNGMDVLALTPSTGAIAIAAADTAAGEAAVVLRTYGYIITSAGLFTALPNTNSALAYQTATPADGDLRVKLLPINSGRFAVFALGRVRTFSLLAGNIALVGTSPSLLDQGLTTVENAAVQPWDAIYDRATGLVWVYYLDAADSRRLLRTSYNPATNLWTGNEVQVATGLGASGSSHVAIRVPRGVVDERRVLVHLGNRTGGGALSTVAQFDAGLDVAPSTPTLTDPGTFNAGAAKAFAWSFSDPNTNDGQSAYEVEIRDQSSLVSAYDPGKVTSGTSSFILAASTLSNGETYEWRVRVYDEADNVSAWTAWTPFSTVATGVVLITDPAADNEAGLASPRLDVTWTFTASGGLTQADYRVRVIRTDTGAQVFDSGYIAGPSVTTYTVNGLLSSVEQRIEVLVRDSGGNISNTATRLVTPEFDTPDVPVITAAGNADGSGVYVTVTNPAPTSATDLPAAGRNDIYRALAGSNVWMKVGEAEQNGAFTDYGAAAGVLYDYKVLAVANTGGEEESAVVEDVSIEFDGVYLHDPTDAEGSLLHYLYGGASKTETVEVEATELRFVGRSFPVFEYGEQQTEQVQLGVTVPFDGDHATAVAALRDVARARTTWCFRDGRGRKVFGAIRGVSLTDAKHGTEAALTVSRVDYDEELP